MPQSESTKNKIEALTTVAASMAIIAMAVIGYQYDRLSDRVDEYAEHCVALRLQVRANTELAKAIPVYWHGRPPFAEKNSRDQIATHANTHAAAQRNREIIWPESMNHSKGCSSTET